MVTESKKIKSISFKDAEDILEIQDELALDEPLCIFINDEYHVTLIASPGQIKELAAGYLLSENIIKNASEINNISTRENNIYIELTKPIDLRTVSVGRMNLIVTACGTNPKKRTANNDLPQITSNLTVKPAIIMDMIRELNTRCNIHLKTRGTHSAILCSNTGEVYAFAEDVGRHNAVDKVIGSLILNGRDPSQCILLSTGRQSGEMVLKAARSYIPIVTSTTVPLVSGVRLAEASGITLTALGLGRLKIYSHPERIIDSS
ncbi:MAG: formate dehydrogenase accessory sulfurtransferase FdhD [Candidatus Bathyarchaeota archaeon]